jgi:electron transfer flavoprotein beta subunit
MNMIVCVKQVPDPETPPKGFKVDPAEMRVIPPLGSALVINPFDENAVEAALRLKDTVGGKITALTLGPPSAEDVLRHAIAMGVDDGVLLESASADDLDSFATAYCLSMAVRQIGNYDLVLCGREAADTNAGQVGLGIAGFLDIPGVSLVSHLEPLGGNLKVSRVIPDGTEVVEVSLPALVTITNELGNPRYPTVKGAMAARKQEITVLQPGDIGIDSTRLNDPAGRYRLYDLSIPAYARQCHLFTADTPEKAAAALSARIMELRPD